MTYLEDAYALGLEVHDRAEKSGRQNRYEVRDPAEHRHRRGLAQAAQALVERRLGATPVNGPFEIDGGRGDLILGETVYEVRHTRGSVLYVFPSDRDEYRYVSVIGRTLDELEIAGWISGTEAKRDAWYIEDHRPGWRTRYEIPLDALYPLYTRPLVCRVCRDRVLVTELPREWIDPTRYECGTCLKPVAGEQIELRTQPRLETSSYNPAQAQIPF